LYLVLDLENLGFRSALLAPPAAEIFSRTGVAFLAAGAAKKTESENVANDVSDPVRAAGAANAVGALAPAASATVTKSATTALNNDRLDLTCKTITSFQW
jgi:hypothetical protein